ncbi:MAG: pyrimidine-nucleoside phosphorylase [Lachnospiraceae bacterium]|nr:pyrimidine-nucleoside phosphorylase [Lachnospiraceae bacterium]
MRMYDCIQKKKHGEALRKEEIEFIVNGYTNGTIPDYQMSAFLMAVCFEGMSEEETLHLTMAMAHSGDMLTLSGIEKKTADKHSTGGVGDKTTLIVGPMVASLGVAVAKMSGRGLGHTGGTIDKLESFPGFRVDLAEAEFEKQVQELGIAVMGQTANLAPADKKIYALRDVTATVDQMALIASSIMSKKLAAGADTIVLDVKTGSGAFMKTLEDSIALAQEMVKLGNNAGRSTYAVVSDMNQPLGYAVGNILEVKEAIDALKGKAPADLMESCYVLAAQMLLGTGIVTDFEQGVAAAKQTIADGSALKKLAEMVEAQGGDPKYVYEPERFPVAAYAKEIYPQSEGYLASVQTEEIGMVSLVLGAGRETKESEIDMTAGLIMTAKIGDLLNPAEPMAVLYANDEKKLLDAEKRFQKAIQISKEPVQPLKHIYATVSGEGVVML